MIIIKVYQYNSILDFGNYKNKTLLEVSILNNTYIDWSINNIANFCVEEDSLKVLIQQNPKIRLTAKAINSNRYKLEVNTLNLSDTRGKGYFLKIEELKTKYYPNK